MNNVFVPKNLAATLKIDPQWGLFITAELTSLHAFALELCERFGFRAAEAGNLFEQATFLGMLGRNLNKPIREEATRAWRSTVLNWIAHELKDVDEPLKSVLLRLSSAELGTLAPSFVTALWHTTSNYTNN